MEKVVTRFAPSPTGYLHAGNYRTAIFAYLFARKMQGEFIVRIEDTDRERSKQEYEDNIHETISWLALVPDRNFRQSGFALHHKEELERLIASGHAYISKETPKEAGQRDEVIRFRNPNASITFTDAIRGPITFDTTDLGDFVIARSIDEPVFHFAVVVDDHDEGITHVIRGEDHISNTPRQILIQQALGYGTPTYAHLPLVLGQDRTKLSKRRGAKALTDYRDAGFVPEAVINYLALIGWHPEGDREVFSPEELVQEFNLARIQKGAGIFDEEKFKWFNKEHLKRYAPASFASVLTDYLRMRGETVPSYIDVAAGVLHERVSTLGEAAELLRAGECAFLEETVSYEPELILQKGKISKEDALKHLRAVSNLLEAVGGDAWNAEMIKEAVFPYATDMGKGAVLWPLRTALSGKEKSPDPFTVAALIGKEKTLARIADALQNALQ